MCFGSTNDCLTLLLVHDHLPCALCVVQNPAWKSEKYADYYYQSKMGIEPDDAEVRRGERHVCSRWG